MSLFQSQTRRVSAVPRRFGARGQDAPRRGAGGAAPAGAGDAGAAGDSGGDGWPLGITRVHRESMENIHGEDPLIVPHAGSSR